METWTRLHDSVTNMTLFPKGKNDYMGDHIPGRPRRSAYFWCGFPLYVQQCEAALADETCLRFEGRTVQASGSSTREKACIVWSCGNGWDIARDCKVRFAEYRAAFESAPENRHQHALNRDEETGVLAS